MLLNADIAAELAEGIEFEPAGVTSLPGLVKRARVRSASGLGETSDIQKDRYEGGLKIWECSRDLANFVMASAPTWATTVAELGRPLRVLEIGCGHGLPGIAALLAPLSLPAQVDFCDFNEEVLRQVTIPNTVRNCGVERARSCRFFSGDWRELEALFRSTTSAAAGSYDVIVSSDTVYCQDNIGALVALVHTALKRRGKAFITGRRFYFGVGGGTLDLCEEVATSFPNDLQCERAQHFTNGVERETIAISFK